MIDHGTSSITHTDVKADSKVIVLLPAVLRPYARLMRLDRPIGAWLLLFPGYWAIALAGGGIYKSLWIAGLFTIGAFVMRGAGCVVNDLWDKDLDAKVERTRVRPLASGELSVIQAFAFLFFLCSIGFFILLQMNGVTIVAGFLSLIPIVIYPLMKRVTWWPQLFLGLTFNIPALMGWTAMTGGFEIKAAVLYLGCIFWTLGYDTIYAHQDKTDDALVGIKSTALLFGTKSKILVGGFYCACLSLLAVAKGFDLLYALIPAAVHFGWQVWKWDMTSPKSSLEMFKSNFWAGWLILLYFLAR